MIIPMLPGITIYTILTLWSMNVLGNKDKSSVRMLSYPEEI